MRILVVDDVGYVRHYLDRLLTHHGHSVVTAASGMKAIELLKKENSFQVVITDLLMPGMDGLELFRAAQKIDLHDGQGSLPRPVFFLITAMRPSPLTTQREPNLLEQALELGFAEVLLKPIDNDYLLRQLANLESKLLRGENSSHVSGRSDTRELLQAIENSVERLLGCEDRNVLEQLTEVMHESLARIQPFIQKLDAQSIDRSTGLEPTRQALESETHFRDPS